MRYIRYVFMAVVGLSLILVALANRGLVTIKVLPAEMAAYLGQPLSYDLPLFVVIFGGIIIGLLIGFVWEWLREHKHRADARRQRREKERLAREVKGLKRRNNEGKDEVLALLDDSAATR
ncbi:lipopolysaccharide assembly protein LapA domain-containing protein [Litoreibacter arenae]|uniref:Phosphate transport regulator n=1 Tax=Litoreibacter arenae DSM 19593 TaxID=1123360 RepID=S9RT80_9RHOB|nr:lipopolysaccharide assembly protein LapA domain-containing protein [Litoreibacter arenae]EPX77129.1 Phosphate transport regulator [Litoreibacter arenae DSM 19593]